MISSYFLRSSLPLGEDAVPTISAHQCLKIFAIQTSRSGAVSLELSSKSTIIHGIRPFAPLQNRVYHALSGAHHAGFENTSLEALRVEKIVDAAL